MCILAQYKCLLFCFISGPLKQLHRFSYSNQVYKFIQLTVRCWVSDILKKCVCESIDIDALLILNPLLFIEQHTSLARTCFFVSFVSDIRKIITLFCNYTNNSFFVLFCELLFESKLCSDVQESIIWDHKSYGLGKLSPSPVSKLRTIQPVTALYFIKMQKHL
jgi:hypothetical protein